MTARLPITHQTRALEPEMLIRGLIVRFAPQLLLGLLVLALLVIKPSVLAPANLMVVLINSTPIAILALGAMWVLIAGGLDLSAGVGVAMCALVLGGMLKGGESLPFALAATVAAGLLLGLVNGTLVGLVGMPAFIATLATSQAVLGVSLVLGQTVGTVVLNDSTLQFTGIGSVGPIPVPILYAAIVVVIVWFLARFTRFGLHTYSIGSNREATVGQGIHVVRQDILVYMFSGLVVALVAILLVARVQVVDSHIAGLSMLLDAFAATILGGTSLFGGRGSVTGTVTGAIFIGLVTTSLVTLGVGPQYVQLMKGGMIVFAVVIDALVRTLERTQVASAPSRA
jgi:ribose transport system permease protein